MRRFWFPLAAWGLLALPLVRRALERTMFGNMVLETSLLVGLGLLLGRALPERRPRALSNWNRHGSTGVTLALFALAFWLLPRHLDVVVNSAPMALARWATLPLLAGVPLGASWRAVPSVARGAIWTHFIAMVAVMGWLFLAAPTRICNNYLLQQQRDLGASLVTLAVLVGAVLGSRAMFGETRAEATL